MEPEETPTKPTLKELLERYDVEGTDTPFKEWFHRAIEQEYSVAPESVSIILSGSDSKEKDIVGNKIDGILKVGDLVKRRSAVSEGAVGIVTRVDTLATSKSHGKKYLVTFQQDGNQAWLNTDQLEHIR